jgi:uncharacterized protein YjbI with pentapeptide repeats
MASEELRKSRLERAKDFAGRARPRLSDKISAEELAAIKKKADDLDAIQKSVSDAAAVGAPLWLSYIFLLFYVAIATGGVTHTQLLLESPVDLPFLNIKLPLKAFFVLAPILFLIVHAYVLAHFAMLSDKAKAFHDRLTAKINVEVENDHAIREGLRQQLPINVFVQFLAGPTNIRESGFGVMLWVIAWTTLVGAPVAVLLLLQMQFLPYHDTRVTWLHRVVLCADLGVIWWLWMKILAGRDRSGPKHQGRWMKVWDDFLWFFRKFAAPLATALVAIFSVLIATFPGEWEDWPFRLPQKLERRIATATEFVFGKVDALNDDDDKRVTGYWPVNTLRLRELDIYSALGIEGPKKLDWKPNNFSLKDRRLEHADLRDARLENIDLRKARLAGAVLDKVNLKGANLEGASLWETSLLYAHLQGASLARAQLQGARFHYAFLSGASLDEADVRGAWFDHALLQGASLVSANLGGATFDFANLQIASLDSATLTATSIEGTYLEGASLNGVELEATSLARSSLWRANWELDEWKLGRTQLLLTAATWSPMNATSIFELRKVIEALPQGPRRDVALSKIDRLDCSKIKTSADLDPCNSDARLPSAVGEQRRLLRKAASLTDEAYQKELASTSQRILCHIEGPVTPIVHAASYSGLYGVGLLHRIGGEAPVVIDYLLVGGCLTITETDRENLCEITRSYLRYGSDLRPDPAASKCVLSH